MDLADFRLILVDSSCWDVLALQNAVLSLDVQPADITASFPYAILPAFFGVGWALRRSTYDEFSDDW